MGILSDTISRVKEEIDEKGIIVPEELSKEYDDYLTGPADKKKELKL